MEKYFCVCALLLPISRFQGGFSDYVICKPLIFECLTLTFTHSLCYSTRNSEVNWHEIIKHSHRHAYSFLFACLSINQKKSEFTYLLRKYIYWNDVKLFYCIRLSVFFSLFFFALHREMPSLSNWIKKKAAREHSLITRA